MSFQDHEAGWLFTGSKINDKKDANQGVVSGIFQITTSVSTFQHLVNTLGTPKDTPELREKLHKIRLHIEQLVKETSAKLKQASETDHHAGVSQSKNIADAKLAKDFQAVLREFQMAQRLAAERETTSTPFVSQAVLPLSYTASEMDINSKQIPEQRPLFVESRRHMTQLYIGQLVKETSAMLKQVKRNKSLYDISVVRSNDTLNIRDSGLKVYILEPYFKTYESFVESNFEDYMADELLYCSSKLLPDKQNGSLRLSVLKRQLIGEGSHRHLYSNIKLHLQSESTPLIPSCKVIVLEKLPLGIFADPFELQHLLQRCVFIDVAVFGDTNLELPSFASNHSFVEVHMNICSNTLFGQRNELEISIDLPLHARYPAIGESGYSRIEFGAPEVFMSCNIEGNLINQSCLFPASHVRIESNPGTVTWRVPSGTRGHAVIVWVFTFFTAFILTLVIVMTSLSSSHVNRPKTFKLS